MKITLLNVVLITLLFTLAAVAKSGDNNYSPTLKKTWTVNMNVRNELTTIVDGRTDSGTTTLSLYSDNTLKFVLAVTHLASGDTLTASDIYLGDAVTDGAVYIPFPGSFTGNRLSGTVQLTVAQADSIQNFPMYVDVHSAQWPTGIMRGQMDKNIIFAANIEMTGSNEVPQVFTSAAGTACLRLADDNTLFSKVVVNNLERGDTLMAAHVHTGAVDANGPVLIRLCGDTADFGVSKKIPLTASMMSSLLTDDVYANAHTTSHPTQIVRGQICFK
jgi:hypothetical protein